MKTSNSQFDVIVIGGGPAGMMAAGTAGKNGARVLLLEKNKLLGVKLRITGGGRCNITNAEFDPQKFVAKYGKKGKGLFSILSRFGVQDTLDFFHQNDLPTMIEAEQRVFPLSESALDVTETMIKYVKHNHVEVMTNASVNGFLIEDDKLVGVNVDGKKIYGNKIILATGGKSRPETGSTGECFDWLSDIGLAVVNQESALVPVKVSEPWIAELMGVSYQEARVTVIQNNKAQETQKGKILFTHFGMSGPLILNMSKNIGEYLKYAPVTLSIDLMPEVEYKELDLKIQQSFLENKKKMLKNVLPNFLPPKFIALVPEITKINLEKEVNAVTKEERLMLVKLLKDFRVTPVGLLGKEKAIVTSGGLDLKEIDVRTMQTKKFPNLYVIGDVLDFERPSGGYSLQVCWSTGYIAGLHSSEG